MADKDKRANGSAAETRNSKAARRNDELGRQADALRAKVNHLIDEMRENDVPADEEVDGGAVVEEVDRRLVGRGQRRRRRSA